MMLSLVSMLVELQRWHPCCTLQPLMFSTSCVRIFFLIINQIIFFTFIGIHIFHNRVWHLHTFIGTHIFHSRFWYSHFTFIGIHIFHMPKHRWTLYLYGNSVKDYYFIKSLMKNDISMVVSISAMWCCAVFWLWKATVLSGYLQLRMPRSTWLTMLRFDMSGWWCLSHH